MKEYEKRFEFDIEDNSNLKKKLMKYFTSYNLTKVKDENSTIILEKKWSLLDGWKLNILNWETKIGINLDENNKVKINHKVITNGFGYITPIAFSSLFEKYLINLEKFINQNESFERKNNELIKLGKVKMLKYIGILIVGILIGFYFGYILENLTEIKLFGYVGIIIGALVSEKILNNYLIKNNTLQQHI